MSLTQVNISDQVSKDLDSRTVALRKLKHKNPENGKSWTKRAIMAKLLEVALSKWSPTKQDAWRFYNDLIDNYFDAKTLEKMLNEVYEFRNLPNDSVMRFAYFFQLLTAPASILRVKIDNLLIRATDYLLESEEAYKIDGKVANLAASKEYDFSDNSLWRSIDNSIKALEEKKSQLEIILIKAKEPDLLKGEIYKTTEFDGQSIVLKPPKVTKTDLKVRFL